MTTNRDRATVLVADDSLVIRAVVRGGLEDEGYRVVEAVDGLAALEQCRRDPPDVILLDIEMPGLDGYEVLAALKGDAELQDIPVVFLTSRSGITDVVAGLRGGAHDYLKKPFEHVELLARVGSAVHVKKLQDQLRQRNADLDRMSRTDALTGLYNRRHLDEQLAASSPTPTGTTIHCACCCSTSITSRRSTTTTVIRLATSCSAHSPTAYGPSFAPTTSSADGG